MKIIIEIFRGGVSAVYYDLEANAKASDALPSVIVVSFDAWKEARVESFTPEPLQDAPNEVRGAVERFL